jgi:Domain of unknown function (DUF4124)
MAQVFERNFMHTSHSLRFFGSKFAKLWLIIALALASSQALAEQKNAATAPAPRAGSIVKWVDEKGVTHYGDSIPPQYSGRDNTELDKQGHVVKRNKVGDSQPGNSVAEKPEVKINPEQQRHDKALLAAYTTEQEFDLARDRNLQTDQAAVEGLNQNMASVKERMAASKKLADGFTQRKKPVPAYITQDMKEHQDEITKLEGQVADRQKSMDETRQRFDADKKRFIQLKLDPNAPPPPAAPVPDTAKPVVATAAPAASGAVVAVPLAPVTPVPVTPAPVAAKPKPAAAPVVAPVAGKPAVVAATPPAPAMSAAKPAPTATTKSPVAATPATTVAPAAPVKKVKRVVEP